MQNFKLGHQNPAFVFCAAAAQTCCMCGCVCVRARLCVSLFSCMKSTVSIKGVWSSSAARRGEATWGRPAHTLAGGKLSCLFPSLLGTSVGERCVIHCQTCGPAQDISPIMAARSPRSDSCGRCERASVKPGVESGCHFVLSPFQYRLSFVSCYCFKKRHGGIRYTWAKKLTK